MTKKELKTFDQLLKLVITQGERTGNMLDMIQLIVAMKEAYTSNKMEDKQ